MACNITLNGKNRACGKSIGGIKEVYIQDYNATLSDNLDPSEYAKYTMRPNFGSWSSVPQGDKNGGVAFLNTVTLKFSNMEGNDMSEIAELCRGELRVMIRDNSGEYFAFSIEKAMHVTEGNIGSGTNMGDMRGWELTLTNMTSSPPDVVVVI